MSATKKKNLFYLINFLREDDKFIQENKIILSGLIGHLSKDQTNLIINLH
jgi:hypothetical protein